MSLRQKVKLELDGDVDDVEVVFDGRDLRAWEVKNKRSSITEPMSVSMLTWLGWNAAKRQGLLNGSAETYEAFDKVCVGVEGVAEEPEDPTPKPGSRTRRTASDG